MVRVERRGVMVAVFPVFLGAMSPHPRYSRASRPFYNKTATSKSSSFSEGDVMATDGKRS